MQQETLLEKLCAGDDRVTKETYLQIKTKFLPWIQQQYGCPHNEALDWYHVSFATVLENIRSGKLTTLSSTLDTYCMSIGKHVYLTAQRRQQRSQQALNDYPLHLDDNDYEQREQIATQITQVATAMDELGDPCRELLISFYHYQQSMQDIATQFGYTTAANARNQKYKCLKRLRKIVLKAA